jgi:hypothetical protein
MVQPFKYSHRYRKTKAQGLLMNYTTRSTKHRIRNKVAMEQTGKMHPTRKGWGVTKVINGNRGDFPVFSPPKENSLRNPHIA